MRFPLLCGIILAAGIRLPSFPQHTVSVKYATEHRCGVCVRGPGLSDAVSGTDPLKDNLPLLQSQAEDGTPEVRVLCRRPCVTGSCVDTGATSCPGQARPLA